MSVTEGNIEAGATGKKLDTTKVTQTDSTEVHREVVVHGDPETLEAYTKVTNTTPPDDAYGAVVRPLLPLSAFGELLVVSPTPQVQVRFPYVINTELLSELHNHASSTASVSQGVLTMTLNGSASNFSAVKTRDVIRYGPGQGALIRITTDFTTGVAESSQVAGGGNDDEGLNFGYDGTAFGIQHSRFGSLEIKAFSITGAADAGGGDFVLTIDGTAVTITVAASDTISEVVAAILAAEDDFNKAGRGWTLHTPDNIIVHFESFVAENAAGTFSFVDTDSGVTAGAFSEVVAGLAPTTTWIPQASWNVDVMDGTGPSGMTLDPTNLNVYEIKFRYLGGGGLRFYIENTETAENQLVHIIRFAGSGSVASMRNPSLQLGMIISTTAAYTGGNLVMKSASMAGFIEGIETNEGIRHSAQGNKDAAASGTTINILTILNKILYQSQVNRIEVFPDSVRVANDSTKTVTFDLVINPTGISGPVSMTDVDTINSVMAFDTAGVTVTGGTVEETFVLAGGTAGSFSLKDTGLRLRPGDRWAVTALLDSGSAGNVSVTIPWRERV